MRLRPLGPKRLLRAATAVGLAVGITACDGAGDIINPNLLDQSLVVGTYDFEALEFDVAGSTFGSYDILTALNLDPTTHFLVIANDGTAQLAFQNPNTGALDPANGTYEMLENGLRISFENAGQPGVLLIPQILDLIYDSETGSLTFIGDVAVPLDRLVSLVPELDGEPLNDPVPGSLTVVFTPR